MVHTVPLSSADGIFIGLYKSKKIKFTIYEYRKYSNPINYFYAAVLKKVR